VKRRLRHLVASELAACLAGRRRGEGAARRCHGAGPLGDDSSRRRAVRERR
jgi:hypothetical protein